MFLESPYKKYIDDALLKLKESGEIEKLRNIWWKEKRGGGKCGVSFLNYFYSFMVYGGQDGISDAIMYIMLSAYLATNYITYFFKVLSYCPSRLFMM